MEKKKRRGKIDSWSLQSLLFQLQTTCRVRNTWKHAQDDLRTRSELRDRAFFVWNTENQANSLLGSLFGDNSRYAWFSMTQTKNALSRGSDEVGSSSWTCFHVFRTLQVV